MLSRESEESIFNMRDNLMRPFPRLSLRNYINYTTINGLGCNALNRAGKIQHTRLYRCAVSMIILWKRKKWIIVLKYKEKKPLITIIILSQRALLKGRSRGRNGSNALSVNGRAKSWPLGMKAFH